MPYPCKKSSTKVLYLINPPVKFVSLECEGMISINWIYLAIGLGFGLGSSWLIGRLGEKQNRSERPLTSIEIDKPSVEELGENAAAVELNSVTSPQADRQDVIALLEQLKQTQVAYQLAQQMSKFKAGFLARTAHELRSPLNSLIGLHQLILSDLCDDPAEERSFVAQAHQSALKLMQLIDRILAVSRLEHGTVGLEIQPLQLANVLTEVYNSTQLLAADRNLRLQLSPPAAEIYVLADPRWLRQALLNLLDTCFTQMREGNIFISSQSLPSESYVLIWLDVELASDRWSEAVNLLQFEHQDLEPVIKTDTSLSLGMTVLLTQTILELMQCRLEIVPIPTNLDANSFTRIQLVIPLVTPEPETASLESEGD